MKALVCIRFDEKEDIPVLEEYGIVKAANQALKNKGSAIVTFGDSEWGELIAKVEVTLCEQIDMGLVDYVASKSEEITFCYKYYCLDEKELEAI